MTGVGQQRQRVGEEPTRDLDDKEQRRQRQGDPETPGMHLARAMDMARPARMAVAVAVAMAVAMVMAAAGWVVV